MPLPVIVVPIFKIVSGHPVKVAPSIPDTTRAGPWNPHLRVQHVIGASPSTFGMTWWEPGRSYPGMAEDIRAIPDLGAQGGPLIWAGTDAATSERVGQRQWLSFPETARGRALGADDLLTTFSNGPNAPFTFGVAFLASDMKPTSLWSAYGGQDPETALTIAFSVGKLRFISSVKGAAAQSVVAISGTVVECGKPQALVVVGYANGTVTCWHNGILVADKIPWARPGSTGFQSLSFGAIRRARSVAQPLTGCIGSLSWRPDALGDADASALADYYLRFTT